MGFILVAFDKRKTREYMIYTVTWQFAALN